MPLQFALTVSSTLGRMRSVDDSIARVSGLCNVQVSSWGYGWNQHSEEVNA